MKALFIWSDGYRDYAEVFCDSVSWDRFLTENPNIPTRAIDTRRFTKDPPIPKNKHMGLERARFYRVDYQDGSFSFVEGSLYFEAARTGDYSKIS